MEIIIVTGQSGAGKTRTLDVLEDIGFYCIDNMPPSLIPVFAEMAKQLNRFSRVAVVTDVRTGEFFSGLMDCIEELKRAGVSYKVLYLQTSDEVLEKRYRETRRRHPLLASEEGDLREAIKTEREMLKPAYELADYRIDTTSLAVSQLRERLQTLFMDNRNGAMMVRCISFGYKYGVPTEADLLFDVRCLPNPFYIEELKNKTGIEEPVSSYVFSHESTQEVVGHIRSLIDCLLPLYTKEGKSQLVIGIGCTGGHHRSVAIAEHLCGHIAKQGYVCRAVHRDIGKVL